MGAKPSSSRVPSDAAPESSLLAAARSASESMNQPTAGSPLRIRSHHRHSRLIFFPLAHELMDLGR
jgi:hypothetical protein